MTRKSLMFAALTVLASTTNTASALVIISACGVFTNLQNGTSASDTRNCAVSAPTGTGTTSADLATGALRTKATGVSVSAGTAGATFSDTVTIAGNLANPIQFHVLLDVHGAISGPAGDPNFNGNGSLMATDLETKNALAFGSNIVQLRNYDGTNNPLTNFPSPIGTSTEFIGSLVPSNVHLVIDNLVTVDATHPSFVLTASLSSAAAPLTAGVEIVDFGNTASLSILLPNGFTFHSASGVLLSTPVPVPPPFALFATGLFSLFAARRRRPSTLHSSS